MWAFEVEKLSDTARQYIGKDVVSGFLEYTETNSNRARVSVESTVTEHTGVVGSELSDTITVDGFPDDHGSFDGNVKLGIGADRAMAQVSVWWAGDPNDSAGDEAYRPQGETPPAEDSNHRLIGVWIIRRSTGVSEWRRGAGRSWRSGAHRGRIARMVRVRLELRRR